MDGNVAQYMVAARTGIPKASEALLQVLELADTRPDIEIAGKSGPISNPHLIVIRATIDAVEVLRGLFGDRLIFEEDQPLELL